MTTIIIIEILVGCDECKEEIILQPKNGTEDSPKDIIEDAENWGFFIDSEKDSDDGGKYCICKKCRDLMK